MKRHNSDTSTFMPAVTEPLVSPSRPSSDDDDDIEVPKSKPPAPPELPLPENKQPEQLFEAVCAFLADRAGTTTTDPHTATTTTDPHPQKKVVRKKIKKVRRKKNLKGCEVDEIYFLRLHQLDIPAQIWPVEGVKSGHTSFNFSVGGANATCRFVNKTYWLTKCGDGTIPDKRNFAWQSHGGATEAYEALKVVCMSKCEKP